MSEVLTNLMDLTRDANIANGKITLTNEETGGYKYFTIKTVKKGSMEGKRIISLEDSNSQWGWRGFGFVTEDSITVWGKYRDSNEAKYARYICDLLTNGNLGQSYKRGLRAEFSRTCIKCNRKLTTPESIAKGIGPECSKQGYTEGYKKAV